MTMIPPPDAGVVGGAYESRDGNPRPGSPGFDGEGIPENAKVVGVPEGGATVVGEIGDMPEDPAFD